MVNWFLKTSGIPDETGRAGKHPGRMEAESMQLEGYTPVAVNPWEAASGGIAVSCAISRCSARFVFEGSPGRHEVRIRYFDQNNGAASFRILLNGQLLDQWVASARLPTQKIDGASPSLRIVPGVALKPCDEIRIEGSPDGGESAALDYIEIQ
jgi:alpha-glucuronidase